jgi:hypothetical protein
MGRGRHKETEGFMAHIWDIARERQPITVRGIAYQLFTRGVIGSMTTIGNVRKVSRVATQMREGGALPWAWIADETRRKEQAASWADPRDFMQSVLYQYRKNFWDHQTYRVEVWSEKSTVSGILAPVLDTYAVAFRVQRGFGSATSLHEAAQDTAAQQSDYPVRVLYVGDYDPSGLYMSDVDIPARLERYGGAAHVERIALTPDDGDGLHLPDFKVSSKAKDPRFKWWQRQDYGAKCWELDALDPRTLRDRVDVAIRSYIDLEAWERCETVERAEHESMAAFFENYSYF